MAVGVAVVGITVAVAIGVGVAMVTVGGGVSGVPAGVNTVAAGGVMLRGIAAWSVV